MSKKKKKVPTNLELIQGRRGSWNGIKPITRVVESKKRKPEKHKKKAMEEASDGT